MLTLPDTELRELLVACLAVDRWADDVVSEGPFGSVDELLATARAAATPLSETEIAEALSHHPRIGERPVGQGAGQNFSRAEQASVDADDDRVNAGIAEGNTAYEERFGRVFLIRAKGRSRAEILSELNRRLRLDEATELSIVGAELRDITLLRLESTLGSTS
ncbi:2-oxo-4-hydroxy-4-carboxy-5-ureidoimidazoline decarboxylase [Subtercola boreus]|uniref:2-oxo-4-hydroxy-4-carboxy-5-ureidoimidazoline decarboxylase n=1 Tax=Subtercola boreus TaxID=120213 RepID=A0A3E0WCY6_9MICO|nr:2-oxo-4-hydroxy-4-carboxy-5-ureidoimidazoline decarboxylase [Subtercola boreus]RFA22420.1 OHCU decarboxylase [Subtercola boreus]RFA22482.1 OHCU decarboxylase [Subtercola boreus]RFA28497.1 OHCU decarboxylase [Subtercola boreus]